MYDTILWDLDDDPRGNVQHIAAHGLTKADVEYALEHAYAEDTSDSSGYPLIFGLGPDGREVVVVFEEVDEATIYPITAFRAEEDA